MRISFEQFIKLVLVLSDKAGAEALLAIEKVRMSDEAGKREHHVPKESDHSRWRELTKKTIVLLSIGEKLPAEGRRGKPAPTLSFSLPIERPGQSVKVSADVGEKWGKEWDYLPKEILLEVIPRWEEGEDENLSLIEQEGKKWLRGFFAE